MIKYPDIYSCIGCRWRSGRVGRVLACVSAHLLKTPHNTILTIKKIQQLSRLVIVKNLTESAAHNNRQTQKFIFIE